MTALSPDEIQPHPSSYVDPHGFVFTYQGELYRAIRNDHVPFYNYLIQSGHAASLEEAGLIQASVSEYVIPEEGCGLVLHHPRIRPTTYCVEWCPSMMKDAALSILELCLALGRHDCLLQDAYPWNILFEGVRPVNVDFTSVMPADEATLLWPAYQQFLSFFLYPLQLASVGKGRVARLLLFDHINGVTIEELNRHLDWSYKIRHPVEGVTLTLSAFGENRARSSQSMQKKVQALAAAKKGDKVMPALRAGFFKRLHRKVEGIRFPRSTDPWVQYREELAQHSPKVKEEAIAGILSQLKPEWVLDLGCNVGHFSELAAEQGARVVSMDTSEACIERLYRRARNRSLAITPLVGDALSPTPAFGHLSDQFPSMIERLQSDVVMCLALMHHLHINGRQSFERIAELLNALSRRAVIFEYVDPADDNNARLDAGRKIDYNIESVSLALSRYFQLTRFESDRPTRTLILCEKS